MFEFDPEKSKINQQKHGIDFDIGSQIWKDPDRLIIPAKSETEDRFLLIGLFNGEIWSCVFTKWGRNIRIISIRKARENEKGIYKRGRV